MDKFDRAILDALQRNSSLSIAQIAERVSLSKTACWHRIQKFEAAGVIKERVTLLDPKKVNLGLTAYLAIRTNRHDQEWVDQFSQLVSEIPEFLEIHRLSGEIDYLLRAVVTDMDGFDRIYKKLIAGVGLLDVSSSFVMETIKGTTVLPLDHI